MGLFNPFPTIQLTFLESQSGTTLKGKKVKHKAWGTSQKQEWDFTPLQEVGGACPSLHSPYSLREELGTIKNLYIGVPEG